MKKILITGGAGFVGRRFVKYFLEKKNKVIVVDNISKYTDTERLAPLRV